MVFYEDMVDLEYSMISMVIHLNMVMHLSNDILSI